MCMLCPVENTYDTLILVDNWSWAVLGHQRSGGVPDLPCSWPAENANLNVLKMREKSHSNPKSICFAQRTLQNKGAEEPHHSASERT